MAAYELMQTLIRVECRPPPLDAQAAKGITALSALQLLYETAQQEGETPDEVPSPGLMYKIREFSIAPAQMPDIVCHQARYHCAQAHNMPAFSVRIGSPASCYASGIRG